MTQIRDIRNPGWLWAERAIIKRDGHKLGAYGIAVYITLCAYANEDQKAWPSLSTIGKLIGCSRRKVVNCLHQLEALGWVRIQRRKREDGLHQSNVYFLLAISEGGSAHHAPPVVHTMHQGSAPGAPERKLYNDTKKEAAPFSFFIAWCKALDIDPKTVPKSAKHRELRYGKELLEAGWTPEEVEACARELKAQEFWQDKPLSLATVVKEINQWHQRQGNKRAIRM